MPKSILDINVAENDILVVISVSNVHCKWLSVVMYRRLNHVSDLRLTLNAALFDYHMVHLFLSCTHCWFSTRVSYFISNDFY